MKPFVGSLQLPKKGHNMEDCSWALQPMMMMVTIMMITIMMTMMAKMTMMTMMVMMMAAATSGTKCKIVHRAGGWSL